MISYKLHKSPDSQPDLLLQLVVIGFLSGLLIISLAGYSTYRNSSNRILDEAKDDSINISQSLAELEKQIIFSPSAEGRFNPSVTPDEIPLLDSRLRPFLKPFGIVKIKIYSRDRQIVFSTDKGIIGKIDDANVRLTNALNGAVDTHLEMKPEFRDLTDELMINVAVVETYVPIRDRFDNVIGCFEIYLNVSKYVAQIKQDILKSVISLAAIICLVFAFAYLLLRKATTQLNDARQKLEELAYTDPLTGLHNRRHIHARSTEEFVRISRIAKDHPDAPCLGIIMLDVDNFKSVNDRYGHSAGDELLVAISGLLRKFCRQYDLAGRYGGEEFLIVLPDIAPGHICDISERIRIAIRSHRFMVQGAELSVTASLGIAFSRPDEADIFSGIKRADEELYLAKRNGRDRVCTVQEELLESAGLA